MSLTEFQETLLTTFISELEEYTNELDNDIIALEANPKDDDLINKIFRAYHSIKSSAGIVGYTSISDFTHIIETIMEKIRQKDMEINENITNALLDSNDILRDFLDAIQTNSVKEENNIISKEIKEKIDKVESTLSGMNTEKKVIVEKPEESQFNDNEKLNYYDILFKPSTLFFETGNEPILYIKDLQEKGEIINSRLNPSELPNFAELDPFKCYLSWEIIYSSKLTKEKIEELFMFIIDDNDILINNVDLSDIKLNEIELKNLIKNTLNEKNEYTLNAITKDLKNKTGIPYSADTKSDEEEETENKVIKSNKAIEKIDYVKVDIRKLDELLNLIGELVINYSQVQNLIVTTTSEGEITQEIFNTMDNFQRLTKEIQEKVMKVRMLPIGPMFNQFYRFVRDVAQKVNKKVKLNLYGTDTELDKSVMEKITDPLRHIVRNSIDHGIENENDRIKAGKSETGNIKLSAYHRAGNVIIEVEDDGRGMNHEKILERAIERELISEEDAELLSRDQILSFIFEPGFSTAETITDLSGRGVGMDVVKSNIKGLGGSIQIKTELGKGTSIQIILPLTLSIIDGMLIKVSDLLFVINIMSIVEIIQPEQDDINPVEEKAELVNVRGEFLPLIRLYRDFNVEPKETDPAKAIVVIVEAEKKKFCIMADELLGQQQVVIKNLDKLLEKAYAITGTTILGDGQIAFILDIPALIDYLLNKSLIEKI